jgi:hypothetical protein
MALITQQCCGGCTLGCADVDGGTTTLLSPVWDLSEAETARVRFDAWYSNIQGAAPTQDDWVIDVSNDGGGSWTNFVNTKQSNESWTVSEIDVNALFGAPDQVRLRFRASDLGEGSIVEAAVDDVRILVGSAVVGVEGLVAQAAIPFALEQNQPNPFRPNTRIAFSIPEMSDVNLSVYNVTGQIVRNLADGVRAPGRYEIPWDGRDARGTRVAAGVYFYRLAAGDRVVTKKLTVMH